MTKTSFLSDSELKLIGFKSYGKNVLISRKASIYNPEKIEIGDNVRIDDFCILSGNITVGSNIHLSAYVALYGGFGIILEDYTGISPKSTIYSAMDDFSGEYLIGPIHPKKYTNVSGGIVKIEKYSQIGCNCVIFPRITIKEGTAIGAMSLVLNDTLPWSIYAGVPAKKINERSKLLLNYIK